MAAMDKNLKTKNDKELDELSFHSYASYVESNLLTSAGLDIKKLTNIATDMFVELMRVDLGYLMLFDEKSQELSIKSVKGIKKECIKKKISIKAEKDIVKWISNWKKPILLSDLNELPVIEFFHAMTKEIEYGISLSVPLVVKGKLKGMINLGEKEFKKPFFQKDLQLLSTLGGPVAFAIENAKLYEKLREAHNKLEIKVKERTAELRQTLEKLEEAMQTVEAATRAKSNFLANMSHELRTPLNAIIGFSEILRAQTFGEINKKQQSYVNHVLTSGKHLLDLINDILDLAKVESGKMELKLSEVKFATLLKNGLVMIKEKAMKHGIKLDLKIPKEMENFTIEADERKLKQVIFNLLSNSAKFTNEGGSIETATWKKGKELFVCITDTGIGLKKEDLERIFGEFEQVDSSRGRKQTGTGLGLALSRRMIELHGGKMWAESEGEGKGSCFTFSIPISTPKKWKGNGRNMLKK